MDLVVVRHSISLSNAKDRISGGSNDVSLSAQGVELAKKYADLYDWQQFNHIYVSPMIRAIETAKILTKGKKELELDERVTEMDFGDWDGQHADPLREKYPEIFDYSGMFDVGYSDYAPNSESYDELTARASDFLDDIKAKHPSEKILVVCHGMTIRAIVAAALGIKPYAFAAPWNIAINHLHFDEKNNFKVRLLTYNERLG